MDLESWNVEQYVDYCKKVIPIVKSIDPNSKISAHADTAAHANDVGRNGSAGRPWEEWHRKVLRELGDMIDLVSFHYYYPAGYVRRADVPLDRLEQDIKEITGSDRIKIYMSEQAPAPNTQTFKPEKAYDYCLPHTIWGATSLAEFYCRAMMRESFVATTCHSIDSATWSICYRNEEGGHSLTATGEVIKSFAKYGVGDMLNTQLDTFSKDTMKDIAGTCGRYTWIYSDGTKAYIDINKNEQICDFWGYRSYDFVRPAWTAKKADGSDRSLYMFPMSNPHPEKSIAAMKFETEGSGPYIMIMAITLTDNGPFLTPTENAQYINTITTGWYDYERFDVDKLKDSPLSAAKYIDKPAGKHGAVKASGENLVCEDGTRIRFWGTEITGEAVFPEKEQADKVALEIANLGYNMVRFSDFDEAVLDEYSEITKLSNEKMDRLCYFVSKLKENGIYSSFSMLSKRKLKSGDGIEEYEKYPEGYGEAAYFSESLIELQKKFNSDFFGYKNQYTGKSFGDDDSVVSIELVNGLSLFDINYGYGRNGVGASSELTTLKGLFNDFLIEKYKTTDELKKNWTSVYDKNDYETLEDRTIEIKANFKNVLVSDNYKKDLAEFYNAIINKYYVGMKNELARYNKLVSINSNGSESPITDTYINSQTDFVTRKYNDAGILNISEKMTGDSIMVDFNPMTASKFNFIADFTRNAVANKPYCAVWGTAAYNLYQAQPSVLMPLFAAKNNWSAIQHTYANGSYDSLDKMDDFYSVYNNPTKLALAHVAAAIFYGTNENDTAVQNIEKTAVMINDVKSEPSVDDAFINNTRIAFSDSPARSKNKSMRNIIKTNNIYWDFKNGFIDIRTPKAEAVTGVLGEAEELPTFKISAINSYVTATLVAVDDNNVTSANHYIFTAVGTSQNKGSFVKLGRQRFDSVGENTILCEPIIGTVTIKRTGNIQVYALNASGERIKQIKTEKNQLGYGVFDISQYDCASSYEILID